MMSRTVFGMDIEVLRRTCLKDRDSLGVVMSREVSKDPTFGQWLDHMLRDRRLGPGCGSAEFEGMCSDWRHEVTWRMESGYRPGLVADFYKWKADFESVPKCSQCGQGQIVRCPCGFRCTLYTSFSSCPKCDPERVAKLQQMHPVKVCKDYVNWELNRASR